MSYLISFVTITDRDLLVWNRILCNCSVQRIVAVRKKKECYYLKVRANTKRVLANRREGTWRKELQILIRSHQLPKSPQASSLYCHINNTTYHITPGIYSIHHINFRVYFLQIKDSIPGIGIPWLQKSMPGTSPSTHTVSPLPTDVAPGT